MCRAVSAKEGESIAVVALLDQAVRSEIATRRVGADKAVFGQQRVRSGVVASSEVDLSQPKGILIVLCRGAVCGQLGLVVMYCYCLQVISPTYLSLQVTCRQ
jgi:hypothetical protein